MPGHGGRREEGSGQRARRMPRPGVSKGALRDWVGVHVAEAQGLKGRGRGRKRGLRPRLRAGSFPGPSSWGCLAAPELSQR